MGAWKPTLALDAAPGSDHLPRFLRIARAISDDVRRGRLRPGDALPGSRVLAKSLGVHRNTVLAAYRELAAEGWIDTAEARGTYVSSALPDVAPPRRLRGRRVAAARPSTRADAGSAPASTSGTAAAPGVARAARIGFDLPPPPPAPSPASLPVPVPPGVLSLAGGVPDVRLVPTAALARAYRRALRTRAADVLAYGDPRGAACLREALAAMLAATRAIAASADDVVVTRGSQMAIDLVARALLRPGDVVAVEALGYRPAWDAFHAAGARLLPVPVDPHGLDVAALGALAAAEPRLRMVYVTPHHQYPTTVALAPGRRIALLDLARRARLAVLEDDYDHEFHYDGRPLLPLASADDDGLVVYVGTLSKVLAPGLRAGYVVAPRPMVDRIVAVRRHVDRQGDHAVEHAVAELLDDGEIHRHIRRVRRAYADRRDALAALLARTFGGALSYVVPPGGTALWAEVDPAIDVDAWAERGLARGVQLFTARHFAFDARNPPPPRLAAARFGFARLTEPELADAIARLALALRGASRGR